MNKTNRISAAAILLGPVISFLSACTYTAPFRRVETTSPENNTAIVTLTAVECKPGQRAPFFADTKRVLTDLPLQAGLLGYSFRFQLFGRKAWTMTVWKNAAARDQFATHFGDQTINGEPS